MTTRCGTLLGFYDHRDSKEAPCVECVEAEKAWWAPPKRYGCGTVAGYHRHYRRGEKCSRCLSAYRDYQRERRRSGGVAQSPRTSANIVDLIEMLGPMSVPEIVDEMSMRDIGTPMSVRRAMYGLRRKGVLERVDQKLSPSLRVVDVWDLTDEGRSW